MDFFVEIPSIVQEFVEKKIVCTEIPLLPCVYGAFEQMQMGYRWNPVEQCSLINEASGGWRESWYVIAQNALGDPFFVDFNMENYPVYVAIHGKGHWNAVEVSENLARFTEILQMINGTNLIFPCDLEFLNGWIDPENEFWKEVEEACQEEE